MEDVANRDIQNNNKPHSKYVYNCYCGKKFSLKIHYDAHRKKIHNEIVKSDIGATKLKFQCSFCDFSAKSRNEMMNHFELVHNIVVFHETLNFPTEDEFLKWKQSLEAETTSRFVIREGSRSCRTHKTTKYNCHRSGSYVTTGKGRRLLKSQGSVKINGYCPARITCQLHNDGSCIVHFCKTHLGHRSELKYLPLSSNEKEEIAQKISLKIPFDEILDQIRDTSDTSSLQRIHLLTKKDLYNIESSYLNSKVSSCKYNSVNIDGWVRQMQNDHDCVLFYKPQGNYFEDSPELQSEDFVLMIMTVTQVNLLKRYGSDCICIDVIQHANSCGLEVITVLALDEFQEGYPCAFLITNNVNTIVLSKFFEQIKLKVGEFIPAIFISDLVEPFVNTWNSVMGIPEKLFYSSWCIDQSWRKNLSRIKIQKVQAETYKQLRTLLTERNVNNFNRMLYEFLRISDPEYSDFLLYFKSNFSNNCEFWAYCHRSQAEINVDKNLERIHRAIIYMYQKGNKTKKLDKGITAIMSFVRDQVFNKLIDGNTEISNKIKNMKSRHKTMEKMNPGILLPSDNGWKILAETGKETYHVERQEAICQNCKVICEPCGVCIHEFQCSCIDSAVKYNMCKHIHLVAWSMKNTNISEESELGEDNDNLLDYNSDMNNSISNSPKLGPSQVHDENFLKRKEILQNSFTEVLNTFSTVEELELVEEMISPTFAALRDRTTIISNQTVRNENLIVHSNSYL